MASTPVDHLERMASAFGWRIWLARFVATAEQIKTNRQREDCEQIEGLSSEVKLEGKGIFIVFQLIGA